MKPALSNRVKNKIIIKKCHMCGHVMESKSEIKKCDKCKKSFLPSNYLGKVKAKNSRDYQNQFSNVEEIYEDDLIKGINVLW
jgi:hypothetical protein